MSLTPPMDELFALEIYLTPVEAGHINVHAGNLSHAAFLDLIRQADPELSEMLHQGNQRRPYTVSGLQGPTQQHNKMQAGQVSVAPGQQYSLRITILEGAIFHALMSILTTKAYGMQLRLGAVNFSVTRIVTQSNSSAPSWCGTTTFTELRQEVVARPAYQFEFASPTAFSMGQHSWGKTYTLFPESGLLFGDLARRWDAYAPKPMQLAQHQLSASLIRTWCDEFVLVAHYELATRSLPFSKFDTVGFQGHITYEVKGVLTHSVAQWLTPLARLGFYTGVGYKTTMGMGQMRCVSIP